MQNQILHGGAGAPGSNCTQGLDLYLNTSTNVPSYCYALNTWGTFVVAGSIAGGDLSGTYPNPTVAKINGGTIPGSATLLGSNGINQPISVSAATATAFLNTFSSTLQGLVPASGGGTLNFLRADGTWQAPVVPALNIMTVGLSGTTVQIGASCAMLTPCIVNGVSFTNTATATGPGSGGNDTWRFWVSSTGTIIAGYNSIVPTCNAYCTPTSGITSFPQEGSGAYLLATVPVTSGVAGTPVSVASIQNGLPQLIGGSGISLMQSSTGVTISATGSALGVNYVTFRTVVQNTIAGSNFSLPSVNPCTTVSHENTTNSGNVTQAANAWNYGTCSFAANSTAATANSVQGMISLGSTWSSVAGIPVVITWLAPVSTTGNVLYQIQGQCVASGSTPGNFGSVSVFATSAVPGTTNTWKNTSTLTLTTSDVLSGCVANDIFLFRLFRDHQNVLDTMTGAAEIVSVTFGVSE